MTENLLKLQNRWTNITYFLEKILFLKKMPLDARIAVVATRGKKIHTKGFFGSKSEKSVKDYINFKNIFPKNFHRYVDCGFRKSGETFR